MAQVKDVVCGMMVDSAIAQFKSEYKGQTYYFCSAGCKTAFERNPEKYVQQAPGEAQHGAQHHETVAAKGTYTMYSRRAHSLMRC
jgi:Cu+-exporting ATPase